MAATSSGSPQGAVDVRSFEDADRAGVLRLLEEVFGTWPGEIEGVGPGEFFDWKHRQGRFGPSLLLVGVAGGRPVAFGAWLRWRLRAWGKEIEALRGVDFAVHPSHRGRHLQVELTEAAKQRFPPTVGLTFSTPNRRSRPGSLQTGGREVGRLPSFVRPVRPLRAAARRIGARPGPPGQRLPDAEAAADVLAGEGLAALLAGGGEPAGRLGTVRDLEFLRWRYGRFDQYRAVRVERQGRLAGVAIFRLIRRGPARISRVCELLAARPVPRVAGDLLSQVGRAASVDFVTCAFPSRRAAARHGFVQSPYRLSLVARPLRQLPADPTRLSCWNLSLGDQELF